MLFNVKNEINHHFDACRITNRAHKSDNQNFEFSKFMIFWVVVPCHVVWQLDTIVSEDHATSSGLKLFFLLYTFHYCAQLTFFFFFFLENIFKSVKIIYNCHILSIIILMYIYFFIFLNDVCEV
jgi:hypothetical protein